MDKAKTEKPDLILLDVVMPDMSGFEATRLITRDEATKHIPVILCTSKSHETHRLWGLRQGATNYVVKPVAGPDLLAKIAAAGRTADFRRSSGCALRAPSARRA